MGVFYCTRWNGKQVYTADGFPVFKSSLKSHFECIGYGDSLDATDMENGKSRLEQTQDEVEEVKVIMLDNLRKNEERSDKLQDLENRADNLLVKCKEFEITTGKVKNKTRWENKKMKLIFIGIGVAAALIFIGVIIFVSLP